MTEQKTYQKNLALLSKLEMNHFYRLTEDVKNPNPDRRKRDRLHRPVWTAGDLFFVRERKNAPHPTNDGEAYTDLRLEFFPSRYYALDSLRLHSEGALMVLSSPLALVPREEESHDMTLHRLDEGSSTLLRRLYQLGKVTVADLEYAAQAHDIDKEG